MHWMTDCKKWKNISRLIDGILAAALAAACVYCGYWVWMGRQLPDPEEINASAQALEARIPGLEASIAEATQKVTQAEAESGALLAAAEAYHSEQAQAQAAIAAQAEDLRSQAETITALTDQQEQLKQQIAQLRTQYGQRIRDLEDQILAGESDYRICYLTFDDGPSYLTSRFLKELDRLDVKATFFTIGVQLQEYDYDLRNDLLRQEALAGHNIANHTYTHALGGNLYHSVENFISAVERQDRLVYEVTGMHTDLVRFPAGSYYCPQREDSIKALEEKGYSWIDWIGNAFDSGVEHYKPVEVSNAVISQSHKDKVTVILMHDWREETLLALDRIVTTLREENYLFLPLFKESSTVGTAKPKWG